MPHETVGKEGGVSLGRLRAILKYDFVTNIQKSGDVPENSAFSSLTGYTSPLQQVAPLSSVAPSPPLTRTQDMFSVMPQGPYSAPVIHVCYVLSP